MAKRFTDSDKWKDEWFCDLSLEHKLAFIFIIDNCDQVGVWKPNFRLAEFQLGAKIDWDEFAKILGKERLLIFNGNSWWLRKFCDFQYGQLLETSKSQTTAFYIKLLKKHSLWIAYTEGMYTPKDKDKDKEKDTVLIKKDKAFFIISDFEAQGYTFGIPEQLTDKLNQFLKYRFERKEPILQGQVIESILKTMYLKSQNEADFLYMIENTMAKGAKNIITDLPKIEKNGTDKNAIKKSLWRR